jgi:hypothetical protein
MTTVTIWRRQAISMPRIPRERPRLNAAGAMGFIDAGFLTLRPVVVTAGILVAAVSWATPAKADPGGTSAVGSSISTVLNTVGIGNNGPVSSAIAQVGQSFCPMLVQPGSNFASSAMSMSGNGGLGGPIAGFLAGQAIQAECPAFMTAISNGTMPFPLGGGGAPSGPFGLPAGSPFGAPPATPFGGLPGAPPFGAPPAPPFGQPPAPPQPFGSNLFASRTTPAPLF